MSWLFGNVSTKSQDLACPRALTLQLLPSQRLPGTVVMCIIVYQLLITTHPSLPVFHLLFLIAISLNNPIFELQGIERSIGSLIKTTRKSFLTGPIPVLLFRLCRCHTSQHWRLRWKLSQYWRFILLHLRHLVDSWRSHCSTKKTPLFRRFFIKSDLATQRVLACNCTSKFIQQSHCYGEA